MVRASMSFRVAAGHSRKMPECHMDYLDSSVSFKGYGFRQVTSRSMLKRQHALCIAHQDGRERMECSLVRGKSSISVSFDSGEWH